MSSPRESIYRELVSLVLQNVRSDDASARILVLVRDLEEFTRLEEQESVRKADLTARIRGMS